MKKISFRYIYLNGFIEVLSHWILSQNYIVLVYSLNTTLANNTIITVGTIILSIILNFFIKNID